MEKIEKLKSRLDYFIKCQNKWGQAALMPEEIKTIAESPYSLFKILYAEEV